MSRRGGATAMADELSPQIRDEAGDAPRWRRWLVESFVIVFSILLAFGIDAWWAHREEDERRREVLNALLLEVRENLAELDAAAARHADVAEATETLVTWSLEGVPADVPRDSLDGLLISAGWFEVFSLGSSTVEALILSGNLDLVRNDSLTMALTRWREFARGAREVVATSREFTYGRYSPWLDENTELVQILGSMGPALPEGYPVPDFTLPSPPRDHRDVVEDRYFRNLLAGKRSIVADTDFFYETIMRPHMRRLEDLLEAELGG